MGRGRKPLPKDYNKLISEVEEKIVRYGKRIEAFQQEREDLMDAKKKEEMESLYNKVLSSGKSVDEIINSVHDHQETNVNHRRNNAIQK